MQRLYSEGVQPILIKGWAAARLYPERGLRPYGDIDLMVRSEQYPHGLIATRDIGGESNIDLHNGFGERDNSRFDDLFERSQTIELDDVDVPVLSPEDHLRVLCLHLLRHGAFRPLWLCDVAVAVETRSPEFDWDLCLSTDKRVADWIACTIGLAHQLLGAQVDDTPVADRAKNLPSWLVPTVLKLWEKPFAMDHGIAKHRAPMSKYLRDPRGLLADLRNRWPDPISATVYTKGPFNELPRWPFQIGECVSRTARFLARLPKALRES